MRRNKSKNNRKNDARRDMRLVRALAMPRPPSYRSNSTVSRTFRFHFNYALNSGLIATTVSPAKLGVIQCIGIISNTQAAGLYEAVQLKRLSLWASPPATGNVVDIGANFTGGSAGTYGADLQPSSQTIGMTEPAYLTIKLSPAQQAGQWQNANNSNSNVWFTLYVNAVSGSTGTSTITCDLKVNLRMTADSRTSGATVTLTTVAVGAFYNLALDNPAGGNSVGNLWIPDANLVTTI